MNIRQKLPVSVLDEDVRIRALSSGVDGISWDQSLRGGTTAKDPPLLTSVSFPNENAAKECKDKLGALLHNQYGYENKAVYISESPNTKGTYRVFVDLSKFADHENVYQQRGYHHQLDNLRASLQKKWKQSGNNQGEWEKKEIAFSGEDYSKLPILVMTYVSLPSDDSKPFDGVAAAANMLGSLLGKEITKENISSYVSLEYNKLAMTAHVLIKNEHIPALLSAQGISLNASVEKAKAAKALHPQKTQLSKGGMFAGSKKESDETVASTLHGNRPTKDIK